MKYCDATYTFEDGLKFTDSDILAFVKLHTHWWQRLNPHRMVNYTQYAFALLAGSLDLSSAKKWFFDM